MDKSYDKKVSCRHNESIIKSDLIEGDTMNKLHDLPNISTIIEAELIHAGVKTPEKLLEIGSKKAFLEIRKNNTTACVSMLCALEGAVQGIRWYSLPDNTKNELKEFYNTL